MNFPFRATHILLNKPAPSNYTPLILTSYIYIPRYNFTLPLFNWIQYFLAC